MLLHSNIKLDRSFTGITELEMNTLFEGLDDFHLSTRAGFFFSTAGLMFCFPLLTAFFQRVVLCKVSLLPRFLTLI